MGCPLCQLAIAVSIQSVPHYQSPCGYLSRDGSRIHLAGLLGYGPSFQLGRFACCTVDRPGACVLRRTAARQHQAPRGHHGATEDREPRSPVFTVCLSMAFALVSVSLHDALAAFVSGRAPDTGIDIAVTLTIGWAVVPLFVTAAWLSRGQRALTIPASVLAVLSPFLTAWLFSWSLASAISTAIPTAFIVLLGYSRSSGRRGFAPSASGSRQSPPMAGACRRDRRSNTSVYRRGTLD